MIQFKNNKTGVIYNVSDPVLIEYFTKNNEYSKVIKEVKKNKKNTDK